MIGEWISGNWGNVASVVGLIVSAFTLRSATRASRAAEEARSYVLVRTMGIDLDQALVLASEIYNSLRSSHDEVAAVRCRDLNDLVGRFSARWTTKLSEGSQNNLLRAKEKLTGLEKSFEKGAEPDTDAPSPRLLPISREVTKIFVEEKAGLERTLDSYGKQITR